MHVANFFEGGIRFFSPEYCGSGSKTIILVLPNLRSKGDIFPNRFGHAYLTDSCDSDQ